MERIDTAFPLLKGVVPTTDVVKAYTGVAIAVIVGDRKGKDEMSKNVSIYKSQASVLEQHFSGLNGKFIATVQQQQGAELPSSRPFSASSAACDHIHNWVLGTPRKMDATGAELVDEKTLAYFVSSAVVF